MMQERLRRGFWKNKTSEYRLKKKREQNKKVKSISVISYDKAKMQK